MDKIKQTRRKTPKYKTEEERKRARVLSTQKWRKNNPEKAKESDRKQKVLKSQTIREMLLRLEEVEKELEKLKQTVNQN